MFTRRKALHALLGVAAGLSAVGCGDSVDTSGRLTTVEEEANRKSTAAMENYAKEHKAAKKKN